MIISCQDLVIPSRLGKVSVQASGGYVYHILGENGAGKSTLLHCMAGLIQNYEGEININQLPIAQYSLQHLSQFRCLHLQQQSTVFRLKVSDVLTLNSSLDSLPDEVEKTLEIAEFNNRILDTLSGGEQQRVLIAQALLQVWPTAEIGQALLMFDEPLQGLDVRHQHLFLRFCRSLASRGNLVIMSLHDVNQCMQYADIAWLMKKGEILACGNTQDALNPSVLNIAFGGKFVEHDLADGDRVFRWKN